MQPTFHPSDAGATLEWRVRNLAFEPHVYQLSIDDTKEHIQLKTTNKKYFRRWSVPSLRRLGLPLEPKALSADFVSGVMIVRYIKPVVLLEAEAARKKEVSESMSKGRRTGGVDCATQ